METIENNCFLSAIQYDKNIDNLVIDVPRDLVIDKNLTIAGELLILAANIYSKPGICLSGKKVTFVANKIRFLGPINAQEFDRYNNKSSIKGPMPGGTSHLLAAYKR